jgi:hypothetical protein
MHTTGLCTKVRSGLFTTLPLKLPAYTTGTLYTESEPATTLLAKPGNKVAYLDESCEQKHDKGQ